MEIRVVPAEESQRSLYLMSQAFGEGKRDLDWWDDPNNPPSTTYGVYEGGQMQAQVIILHFQAHFGAEAILPMGGIAGVTCLPACRGKGYASACMKRVLEAMRDSGECISTLSPFSHAFYRRLGYEWVGEQWRYTATTEKLKTHPETENVRAATPEDRPAIREVYTQWAKRYRGMIARDDKHWAAKLDDSKTKFTYTYLYEKAGQAQGYLSFRMCEEGGTAWLRQCLGVTPDAKRALLGLLKRHDMQIGKCRWRAAANDRDWMLVSDWELHARVEPNTMGRVVDVPGALAAWRPQTSARGAVTVAIQDECAPWNAGTWRIEVEEGQITARRADAEPQIRLDIQAFSQAFFGTPTVEELRRVGRLTARDEGGFATFRALLDGPPMWMDDDF